MCIRDRVQLWVWFASPVQLTPLKSSSFRLFWLFLDLLKMVLVEPIPPRRRVGLRMQFEAEWLTI